jgi:putative sigma-54 modulation protein
MQIIIKGRQLPITPQLRQHIEHKMKRLARLVDEDVRVEVTVSEEQTKSARDRYSVHLALAGGVHPVRSEVSALNTNAALDLALDKVVAQLGRQKQRKGALRRHQTARVLSLSRSGQLALLEEERRAEDEEVEEMELLGEAVSDEENEQIWSRITEIRRLRTQPMNDQEVIAEMEKTGVAFYAFFNAEMNGVNVMYRLEDGGYGLLVPSVV